MEAMMPYGQPNPHNGPGWMDIHSYLTELRATTGKGWCVCVAATTDTSRTQHLLFSVCEFRAGTPVVRDDLGIVSGHWPNTNNRRFEAAVFELLVRFDRRLAERSDLGASQSAF